MEEILKQQRSTTNYLNHLFRNGTGRDEPVENLPEVYDRVCSCISPRVVDFMKKSCDDLLVLLVKNIKSATPYEVENRFVLIGTWQEVTRARVEVSDLVKSLQNKATPELLEELEEAPAQVDIVFDYADVKVNTVMRSPESLTQEQKSKTSYSERIHKQSLIKDSRFPKMNRTADSEFLAKNFAKMKLASMDKCSCQLNRNSAEKPDDQIGTTKCEKCSNETTEEKEDTSEFTTTFRICALCNFKAEDVYSLLRHMRLKHCKKFIEKNGVVSEVLKCTKCYTYQTTDPNRLKKHQKLACTKQIIKTYQCDRCYYKTHQKDYYVKHLVDGHANDKTSGCYCKKKCTDALLKSSSNSSSYICETCGKCFNNSSTMKQHLTVCSINKHLSDTTPEKKVPRVLLLESMEKATEKPVEKIPLENVTEKIPPDNVTEKIPLDNITEIPLENMTKTLSTFTLDS